MVASAFWRGDVENELRRVGMVNYKFKLDEDYDKCMAVLDEMRRESIFIPTNLQIPLQTTKQEVGV